MEPFTPIKENRDFRRIYARGKPQVSPVLVTYIMKNRLKMVRAGITTSKKTGNAVQRNRSRRIIREAFRQAAPGIRGGYDFILVARGRTPHVKSTDIYRVLRRQLREAGVLLEDCGENGARQR